MPTDHDTVIAELKVEIRSFCEARDWDQFHGAKDLAIAIEASDTEQLEAGMYGPLLVLEPGESYDPETGRVLIVGSTLDGWATLNGLTEPVPLALRVGTEYRLRFINILRDATVDIALHEGSGPTTWRALAEDGAGLPPDLRTERTARVRMGVGETYDFLWTPAARGQAALIVHVPFPTLPGSADVRQRIRIR